MRFCANEYASRPSLNRAQRGLKRAKPRHAFDIGLVELVFAQGNQRAAVIERFDFNVSGIFRARCKVGAQVGDPSDPWVERSLTRRPCRIGDHRRSVERKRRAHFSRLPDVVREFHQWPKFGGAPGSSGRRAQGGEPHRDYIRPNVLRQDVGTDVTRCVCITRFAEIIGRRSRVTSPDIAPVLGHKIAVELIAEHFVDQKIFGPGLAQGNGNRFFFGFRREQPTLIDRIEGRQPSDKLRESPRVVGLRWIARLPPKRQFWFVHRSAQL
jgi:hypothetical protein